MSPVTVFLSCREVVIFSQDIKNLLIEKVKNKKLMGVMVTYLIHYKAICDEWLLKHLYK